MTSAVLESHQRALAPAWHAMNSITGGPGAASISAPGRFAEGHLIEAPSPYFDD